MSSNWHGVQLVTIASRHAYCTGRHLVAVLMMQVIHLISSTSYYRRYLCLQLLDQAIGQSNAENLAQVQGLFMKKVDVGQHVIDSIDCLLQYTRQQPQLQESIFKHKQVLPK